ncbi:hypothetical protein EAE99_010146 [Botrytis elliptica]|nr:hypothetical protein EAE99_010146 [Botrytis elliptica]
MQKYAMVIAPKMQLRFIKDLGELEGWVCSWKVVKLASGGMYLGDQNSLRRIWIYLTSAATGTHAHVTHAPPFVIRDVQILMQLVKLLLSRICYLTTVGIHWQFEGGGFLGDILIVICDI